MIKKVLIGVAVLFVILIIVSIRNALDKAKEVAEHTEATTGNAQSQVE